MAQNILVEDPHIQSRAAYSLLKRRLEVEGEPAWEFAQRWRREFLQAQLRKGPLRCEYCGTGPLQIARAGHRKVFHATIDHVIPVYLTLNPFDVSNVVVACTRCNNSKGGCLLSEWTNRPKRWDIEMALRAARKAGKSAKRKKQQCADPKEQEGPPVLRNHP